MSKFVMTIFGASGDLTKRKLMPALYTLYKEKRLPESFAVLGVGRTEYQDDTYRAYISSELERLSLRKNMRLSAWRISVNAYTIFPLIPPMQPIMGN